MNPSDLSQKPETDVREGLKHDKDSTKEKVSMIGFDGGHKGHKTRDGAASRS